MPHIHDLIDYTVEVFVVYKNRVLLRKHDKYKKWLSVGGHIELDEDPNQAAIREVKEEVGLEIILDNSLQCLRQKDNTKELIPPYFLNRHEVSANHEHIVLVYFARSRSDKISQTIEKEKSEDCRWFSKEELLNDKEIIPNIKHYALEALEALSHK